MPLILIFINQPLSLSLSLSLSARRSEGTAILFLIYAQIKLHAPTHKLVQTNARIHAHPYTTTHTHTHTLVQT